MDSEDIIEALRDILNESIAQEESDRNKKLIEDYQIILERNNEMRKEIGALYSALNPVDQYFKCDKAVLHIKICPSIKNGLIIEVHEKQRHCNLVAQRITEYEAFILSGQKDKDYSDNKKDKT